MSIWRERAENLFDLLDDIDTADDVAKDNDVLYRRMTRALQAKRWDYATTDGYTLAWKDKLPLKFEMFPGDDIGIDDLARTTYERIIGA